MSVLPVNSEFTLVSKHNYSNVIYIYIVITLNIKNKYNDYVVCVKIQLMRLKPDKL